MGVPAHLREVIKLGKAEVEPSQQKEQLGSDQAEKAPRPPGPPAIDVIWPHMPAGHAVTRQTRDTPAREAGSGQRTAWR